MNRPSSTITAATLAGTATTIFWGLIATFTEVQPDPMLISGTTAFIAALVGYFKKENVLPVAK